MSQCDAVVVEVVGDEAWVELPARAAGCGNCRTTEACSAGLLGNAGLRRYRLANTIGARVGDRVRLDVAEGTLWQASLASYVTPLLLALGAAAIGQLAGGDAGAIAGMLLGLGAGLVLLRRREMRARRDQDLISLQLPTREVRFEEAK